MKIAIGLIPTYAGNTWVEGHFVGGVGAHPHVCGEHGLFLPAPLRGTGSSPRMRGTLPGGGHEIDNVGLIPTYAGNTSIPSFITSVTGAHPHVCGEHETCIRVAALELGSSPRMRGTQDRVFGGNQV